jgi:hypothetical protein
MRATGAIGIFLLVAMNRRHGKTLRENVSGTHRRPIRAKARFTAQITAEMNNKACSNANPVAISLTATEVKVVSIHFSR